MTTRFGQTWLVLRPSYGGPYVAARSDSEFARTHKAHGTLAGSFRTLTEAQDWARMMNRP